MKNFIYLPLIALIILTGCKSSSFTTQRYTKFGHHPNKNTTKNIEVVKQESQPTEAVETEVVKSDRGPVQLIASGISTLKEKIVKPKREKKQVEENDGSVVSIAGEGFSGSPSISYNTKPSVQSQKVVSQKAQQARGLIGDAFETAIWIVLVVIFVILIVFLLSVIF